MAPFVTCACVLALLAPTAGALRAGEATPDTPVQRIAVVPFLNTSGDKALDSVADRLTDFILAGLTGKPKVDALERRAVDQLVQELDFGRTALVTDEDSVTALAKRARASHLVLGSLYKVADDVRVTARLAEVDRFRIVRTAAWTGAPTAVDEKVGETIARQLLGLPAPEPENVRKARELFERATFLYNQELYAEAIQAAEKAVDLVADDVRVHLLLARCYAAVRGRGESAIKEALKATRLDPASPEAWHLLGEIYLKEGEAAKAVPPLKTAVKLAPGSAMLHSALGRALFEGKRFDEAAAAAEAAIAIDGKWADGHNVLGHALAEKDQPARARTALERAVALAPSDALFACDLAVFYEAIDDLAAAIRLWEKTLTLLPERSERAAYIRRHLASLKERVTPPER